MNNESSAAFDAKSEEIDELRARVTELEAAAKLALSAIEGVVDFDPDGPYQWSVSGGTYEAVECNQALTALRKAGLE